MSTIKDLEFLDKVDFKKDHQKTNIFIEKMKKVVNDLEIFALSDKMEQVKITDEVIMIIKQFVKCDNEFIGLFKKNNKPAFRGPKNGLFYVSESFQKRYFKGENQIDTQVIFSIQEHYPELLLKEKNISKDNNDNKKSISSDETLETVEKEKQAKDYVENESLIKEMEKSNNVYLGPYSSKGSANGRPLFQGPKGGKFYISANGSRQYVRV